MIKSTKAAYNPQSDTYDYSEYSSKKLRSNNVGILIANVLMFVTNIAAFVCMVVQGYTFASLTGISILIFADVVHFVFAILTNYHFGYAIRVFVLYAVVSVAMTIVILVSLAPLGAFSTAATVIFCLVRAFSLATLFFGFFAARKSKLFLTLLSSILAFVSAAVFIAFCAAFGFYGQTGRAVRYTKSDGGSYAATSVLNGLSSKINIPERFNGDPVVRIDAALLKNDEIDAVNISASQVLKIDNAFVFMTIKENDVLPAYTVPSDLIDDYKTSFYKGGKNEFETYGTDAADILSARFVPRVEKDEVYVTFRYHSKTMSEIPASSDRIIPTYIAKRGSTFSASDLGNFAGSYLKRTDLSWNHASNGGKHMGELKYGLNAAPLVGAQINESACVDVSFYDVYEIHFDTGSTLFHPANWVETAYVSREFNDLDMHQSRTGCTADWWADDKPDGRKTRAVDGSADILAFADEKSVNRIYLTPVWSVDTPVINNFSTVQPSPTYGDDVGLRASAKHALPLSYKWVLKGGSFNQVGDSPQIDLGVLTPGTYTYELRVTATDSFDSTLKSKIVTQSLEFTVEKKTLTATWTYSDNTVYDATARTFDTAIDLSELIGGDVVTVSNDAGTRVKNAATYDVNASLSGSDADKYVLNNKSVAYTVEKRPVDIIWSGTTDLIYSGMRQSPAASANLLSGDSSSYSVSGGQIRAGKNYTAAVSMSNGNYAPENPTVIFLIGKLPLGTPAWSDTSLTYTGGALAPNATITDVFGSPRALAIRIDGDHTNVGTSAATAVLPADTGSFYYSDYQLPESGCTHDFTVTQKPVAVLWRNQTLQYTGASLSPTATYTDVSGTSRMLNVTIADGHADAGDYGATAALPSDTAGYKFSNYVLTGSAATLTITQKTVVVTWSNTSQTYTGSALAPSATFTDIRGDAKTLTVSVSGGHTDTGTYTATAVLPNDAGYKYSNYTLSAESAPLTVTQKTAVVVWSNRTLPYTGSALAPSATFTDAHGETITLPVTVSGGHTEVGAYVAKTELPDDSPSYRYSNYTLPTTAKTTSFSITPKQTAVTWKNLSREYTGSALAPDATFTDVNGKTQTLSVSVSGAHTDAGTYTATALLPSDSGSFKYSDYSLTGSSATLTITQKTVVVTWSGTTQSYTGTALTPGAVFTDVSGKTQALSVSVSGGHTEVGTYTATAALPTWLKNNYTLQNPTQTLSITAAGSKRGV